jgi:uncharacterized protein (TIGR00725 family)
MTMKMKIKIGVMGSADDALPPGVAEELRRKAEALGDALAARDVVVLTGGTTGLPHLVGRTAHEGGAVHVGISPASDEEEHRTIYGLPTDGTSLIIYTGFGLKGRNVVLVRSCDIVLFIRGSIGALNEFTIAHDEGRIIGCLTSTGGVADEAERLLQLFPKQTGACVLHGDDPARLLAACLEANQVNKEAGD